MVGFLFNFSPFVNDSEKQESLPEGMNENNKKCCTDCKTTKTPLWRGGPAGPKVSSLLITRH